jgi:hypothetical protein
MAILGAIKRSASWFGLPDGSANRYNWISQNLSREIFFDPVSLLDHLVKVMKTKLGLSSLALAALAGPSVQAQCPDFTTFAGVRQTLKACSCRIKISMATIRHRRGMRLQDLLLCHLCAQLLLAGLSTPLWLKCALIPCSHTQEMLMTVLFIESHQ